MLLPGIMATAIQNKEKSAERELMEYLEQVSYSLSTTVVLCRSHYELNHHTD